MSASHPSRSWKGCPVCCAWRRGEGYSHRMKYSDLRRAGGRTRRIGRRDTSDEDT